MRSYSWNTLTRLALKVLLSALIIGGSRTAAAQTATKGVVPDSAKALIGTWEGTYDSDHAGSGAMKIVIAKDSVLEATSLAFAMGGSLQSMPVHDFAVTSDDISWIQETMGTSCQATAVLKSGQMKGAIICGHGQVTFTLTKRPTS